MRDAIYLELDHILAAAQRYLGRPPAVSDYGLLESALAKPKASVFGEDAYPTIHGRAVALLQSLVKNHALVDGNKRLGWVAMRLFYGFNGHTVSATEDEKFDLVLAVATGQTCHAHQMPGQRTHGNVGRPSSQAPGVDPALSAPDARRPAKRRASRRHSTKADSRQDTQPRD